MSVAFKLSALAGTSLLVALFGPVGEVCATEQSTAILNLRLQEGASFVKVRARLIKSGWKPIRMHDGDNYEYDGAEKRLADRNFFEVDSCSTDRGSLCTFYYAKDGTCLRVDTVGEQVDLMRVTRWDDSCPNEPPKVSRALVRPLPAQLLRTNSDFRLIAPKPSILQSMS